MTHKPYIVEWKDIAHSDSSMSLKEAKRQGLITYCSVGFLIKRGKEAIVIAGSISHEGHIIDILTIPKNVIVSVRELK